MHLFYTPDVAGAEHTLNEEESKHCARVLRLAEGDTVHLADGRGTLYTTRIADANPKACKVRITDTVRDYGKRHRRLHLAVALTKNMERYEWMLEKATEIGVEEITPLYGDHSERRTLKRERAERVLIAAMKQSLRAQLPQLHPLTSVAGFVEQTFGGRKLIAHCEPATKAPLTAALADCRDAVILIGPEGDFSPDEIAAALQHGFTAVTLGDVRLRVETAALMACCLFGG
ncbi:MAG: 16S rRNA (uracil(1498)-N(3))-methyltransferase [Prevotellaceae bacterium]|nr:16S rRNA (uracil(1498)-N(3))-methyltransferase [Prevotellaceae bacterium]